MKPLHRRRKKKKKTTQNKSPGCVSSTCHLFIFVFAITTSHSRAVFTYSATWLKPQLQLVAHSVSPTEGESPQNPLTRSSTWAKLPRSRCCVSDRSFLQQKKKNSRKSQIVAADRGARDESAKLPRTRRCSQTLGAILDGEV